MLDLKLSGKTAIVTGGSSGIGMASVEGLFKEGVNVALVSRSRGEDAIRSIKKRSEDHYNNEMIWVQSDLTKADSSKEVVQTAIDRFGKIDILVNCAGAAQGGAFLELESNVFVDAWQLKLLGYIRMIKAVASVMIQNRGGRIVNIVGASGRTPSPNLLPLSTTNAALINFTRGISKEFAQYNIRVNAISPAMTETDRAKTLIKQIAKSKKITIEEAVEEATQNIPVGRMVNPAEIATMALYLVSDLAASITGAEILIDGGQTPGI